MVKAIASILDTDLYKVSLVLFLSSLDLVNFTLDTADNATSCVTAFPKD